MPSNPATERRSGREVSCYREVSGDVRHGSRADIRIGSPKPSYPPSSNELALAIAKQSRRTVSPRVGHFAKI